MPATTANPGSGSSALHKVRGRDSCDVPDVRCSREVTFRRQPGFGSSRGGFHRRSQARALRKTRRRKSNLLVGIGTVPAIPVDIGFPAQGEEGVEGPDCRTGQTAEKSAEDVHLSVFCTPQSRRSLPTKRKRGTEIPLTETGSGKPSGLNRTQSHATERDVEITMPIFSLNKIYQIYKVSIFTEKKIQESDNKIAIYQYIIYRFGFAVACVGFGSLVLVWCIFVSCLFLGFGFYS